MAMIQEGTLSSKDIVWNESMPDWLPIGSVHELKGGASSGAPTMAAGAALSPARGHSSEKIPTYLWQSIVCLLFCCLPAAVAGIVFAAKTSSALSAGDIATARHNSALAKKWCLISFWVGLVFNILFIGLGAVSSYLEASGVSSP